jgi:hypothetical protein
VQYQDVIANNRIHWTANSQLNGSSFWLFVSAIASYLYLRCHIVKAKCVLGNSFCRNFHKSRQEW